MKRHKRPKLKDGLYTAGILWPTFVQQGGCIFVDLELGPNRIDERPIQLSLDRTGTEASENAIHVMDLFEYDPTVWSEKRAAYKRKHPLFMEADRFARVMAASWFCKLRDDFASWRFRVYVTLGSGPTVRFHRVYPDEPHWYEPDAASLASGEAVLLDSALWSPPRSPSREA